MWNCRQLCRLEARKCGTLVNFVGWRPESVELSSILEAGGPKVWNCRQFCGLEARKCGTVVNFVGWML